MAGALGGLTAWVGRTSGGLVEKKIGLFLSNVNRRNPISLIRRKTSALTPPFEGIAGLRESNYGPLLFLLGATIGAIATYALTRSTANARQEEIARLNTKIRSGEADRAVLQQEITKLQSAISMLQLSVSGLESVIKEKAVQFPWIATAYADLQSYLWTARAKILEHKKHPAMKAAEQIRALSRELRAAEVRGRQMAYRVEYYEDLVPWLPKLIGADLESPYGDPTAEDEHGADPAGAFMAKAEYQRLSPRERAQVALDRYNDGGKSPWQMGREYERFIGWWYEEQGYVVDYFGALEGLSDLGRDLICRKKGAPDLIVQCKCWSASKTIHEKHVVQLFGTAFEYGLDKGSAREPTLFDLARVVQPVLITSTSLSDTARRIALALNVQVIERRQYSAWPQIKCNVGAGGKIYHLPFDQQYDRVKIDRRRGETNVRTVDEAEKLGFRRAWKWRAPTAAE